MTYDFGDEVFKTVCCLIGVDGEENTGDVYTHGGAVCGGDVHTIDEIDSWGMRLNIEGPGQRIEGLGAVEEFACLLKFEPRRRVWRRG